MDAPRPDLSELTPQPLRRGSALGRYRVTGMLGAGGMGEILSVYDARIGREVAAKVVAAPATERRLMKFLREGQITGQLEHPGIVPLHEIGEMADGRPYFTMRQIRGRTLADQLLLRPDHHEAWRGWPAPLRAFLKVCDAVAFAHSRNVIHRDLKPDNVMVGEFGEVLVVDWGLAKIVGEPDTMRDRLQIDAARRESDDAPILTRDGAVVGTPAYMSPEQARGDVDDIDRASDVYALGAILYEILGGRAPYFGPTWLIVEALSTGEPPRPPSTLRRDVPRELEAVVAKAMSFEKEDRYPSVPALARDIEAFLDGRPLGAAHYTAAQRAAKWASRHRGLVAALVAIAVISGGVAWMSARTNREARRQLASGAAAQAARLASALPDSAAMRAALVVLGRNDRDARQTRARLHETWKAHLGAHLAAVSAIDRALLLSPDDPALRTRRRTLGTSLGWCAMLAGNATLARQCFRDLETWGAPRAAIEELEGRLARLEDGIARWRRERVARMLDDMGRPRAERELQGWRMQDYVIETVAIGGAETVAIVGKRLTALAGQAPRWTTNERDQASYCCAVLGRLGLPGCVAPLETWLGVQRRRDDVIEAALALCNTRRPEAYAPLMALATRYSDDSAVWRRIAAQLWRVPEPADMTEHEPRTAKLALARAMSREAAGKREQALADLDRAVALEPHEAQYYTARGKLLMLMKRYPAAREDLDKAIALDPRSFFAHNIRGILRRRTQDYHGALEDFRRANALDPDAETGYFNQAIVLKHDLRKPAEALEVLARAERQGALASGGWALRSELQRKRRDLTGALRSLDRARSLDPRNAEILYKRGRVLRLLRRYEEARLDLAQALKLVPTGRAAAHTRLQLAMVLRDTGEVTRERAALDEVVARHPGYFAGYHERGRHHLMHGQYKRALADIELALARAQMPDLYYDRGRVRGALGDREGALADYSEAIRRGPTFYEAYINRGATLNALGRHAEAEPDFRKAISLRPKGWLAYSNLGIVLAAQKRTDAAIEAFQRARELAPTREHAKLDGYLRRLPRR